MPLETFANRIRPLNLALQGGGSHGAFTWGALDRLLQEPGLIFEAVSGTSSGAINAAVMAQGIMDGGREGGRAALAQFWNQVAAGGVQALAYTGYQPDWMTSAAMVSPVVATLLRLTREFSPYQINPFGLNPLRDLLESSIRFDLLREKSPLKLFVSATEVRTGKLRIFRTPELNADVLLASSCLPSIHHAVMIDGEPYWDGAFTGNPPVFPLLFECDVADVMVIVIQPWRRAILPLTSEEIRARTLELAFSSAFLREMRAITMSKQHISENRWLRGDLERRLERLNIHLLQDAQLQSRLNLNTRVNSLPTFITGLHGLGFAAAESWLESHFHAIGECSTVDLEQAFA